MTTAPMPDFHMRLRVAIQERMELAETAADGSGSARWIAKQARCECCERIMPGDANGVVPGAHSFIAAFDDRISPHVVANDPATIQQQCIEDFDVLTRHYVCNSLECGSKGLDCHTCRDEFHPCPEVQSIGRRYGIQP
jgi:hypothetical protein